MGRDVTLLDVCQIGHNISMGLRQFVTLTGHSARRMIWALKQMESDMYIVTVTHNGREVPLRGTIWAFKMDRAQQFETREAAQAALDHAKKFMHAKIYRKAVIKEVTNM